MKLTTGKPWLILFSLLIIALLAACGGTVEEPAADSTRPADTTDQAVSPVPMDMDDVTEEAGEDDGLTEMPQPGIPDPEAFMSEQVRMALSDRLGVDFDSVSIVSVSEMEWSDSALGCPDPDQTYAQVITPGYEITVAANGETYNFHTDTSGAFVLCGADGRPVGELLQE